MKILLTGANGLVGQKIKENLAADPGIQLIATSFHQEQNPLNKRYTFETLDITNQTQLYDILNSHQPEMVINSAALANVNYCEKNKEECQSVNTEAVKNMVQLCNRQNCHFIQVSTDFVFNGSKPVYEENDTPSPLSYYGISKKEAEEVVMNECKSWAIVRTILVYGYHTNMKRNNIISWVIEALSKKEPIRVVNDQHRCPTLAEDLAFGIKQVARNKLNGVFHISGDEMYSVAEIAYRTADFFKLEKTLISEVTTLELNEPAKRPAKTKFNLSKAKKYLNYQPHSLQEGLKIIERQMNKKLR